MLAVVVVDTADAPATLDPIGAVAAGAAAVALDALAAVGAAVFAALGLTALVAAVVGLAAVGVLAVLDPPQATRSNGTTKRSAIPMRDACIREAVNRVLTPSTLPNTWRVSLS